MLIDTLKNYWFSNKEAKIYLACLELGNTIASSIARKAWENRITTYSILKELKKRHIILEISKDWIKYFSAISPKKLLKNEELKIKKLKNALPELLALSNTYNNKPKVYFYEGVENLKNLYKDIIEEWKNSKNPYLSFAWTKNINHDIEEYLKWEFIKDREKVNIKSKVILSNTNWKYNEYHKDKYNHVIINDPIFEMWNEIVMYWTNKIGILNYTSGEIYGLSIKSKSLYKSLESMFNLIWKAYKK